MAEIERAQGKAVPVQPHVERLYTITRGQPQAWRDDVTPEFSRAQLTACSATVRKA